jgi:2-keto-4-pentenoate hydratase
MTDGGFDPAPAAVRLRAAWRGQHLLQGLSATERPPTIAEAYRVQTRLIRELSEPIGGYKLGLSSAAAMARSGLGDPILGFALASSCLQSGAALSLPQGGEVVIEAEIAFVQIETHDGGTVDFAEGRGCTAHLALEIVRSRFASREAIDLPTFVGDASGCHAIVLGDAIPLTAIPTLLEQGATLLHEGRTVAEGALGDECPSPFDMLHRFRRLIASHGLPVPPRMVISTGSITLPFVVGDGGAFEARLSAFRVAATLGRVSNGAAGGEGNAE